MSCELKFSAETVEELFKEIDEFTGKHKIINVPKNKIEEKELTSSKTVVFDMTDSMKLKLEKEEKQRKEFYKNIMQSRTCIPKVFSMLHNEFGNKPFTNADIMESNFDKHYITSLGTSLSALFKAGLLSKERRRKNYGNRDHSITYYTLIYDEQMYAKGVK